MSEDTLDIIIVGAGASGVLLAGALVRPPVRLKVALVDPSPVGGPAFGSGDNNHLLNTRVGNMSLESESPSGFLDWLKVFRPRPGGWSADAFVSRRLYGDYLLDRLANLTERTPGLGSTQLIQAFAQSASRTDDGWSVQLLSGETLRARALVLATGLARPRPLLFHGREAVEAHVQDDPWDDRALRSLPRGGTVLLVGSGLTAMDVAAALWRRDPETRVITLSHHGLLPRVHASPAPGAPVIEEPYPTTARELYERLRTAAELVEGDAALRHGVFLNLREIGPRLWAALPDDERLVFLRHFRRFWEVERHRLPPAQAEVIGKGLSDGRLEVARGRLAEAKPVASGQSARVALMTRSGPRALEVGRIINCTGPEPDPFRSRNPLLLDLLAQGEIAADPLGLGLRVDDHGAAIGSTGHATPGLYALGPLTQGQVFEATAVAEIRGQADLLAGLLLAEASVSGLQGAWV